MKGMVNKMKKQWRRIVSLIVCVALVMSMNTNVIALTTDWNISSPELEEKASEVRLDAAVKDVIDKIDAIGTVEYNDVSLAKILEAESAYKALTDAQKEQVSNYGTLLAARKAYDVLAADHEDTSTLTVTDSGIVNSTVEWYFYSNGLLEIAGEGSVPVYTTSDTAPWFDYADSINRILVRSSITEIGAFAFYGLNGIKEITLPFVGKNRTATGYESSFGYVFGTRYVVSAVNYSDYYIYDKNITSATSSRGTYSTFKSTDFVASRVAGRSSSYSPYYGSGESYDRSWYSCYNYSSSSRYYLQTYYFAVPSAIKTVTITDAEKIEQGAFNNCNDITNINLNDGITTIGAHAFENNSLLKNLIIPESVATIGESAFYGDYSFTEVYVPDSVTKISEYAFYACTGVAKLVLGKNTVEIGDYAFYNNSALKNLTIPEKVENIGNYAFSKNITLTGIVIPDSVKTIGQYSFADNTKVLELSIGSALETISAYAFSNNTSLTEITVPDTITTIEGFAFNGCSSLKKVTLPFVGESRTATGYQSAFGYIFGTRYIVNASNSSDYYIYDKNITANASSISTYYTVKSTDFVASRVAGRSSTYSPYYNSGESYDRSWYSCYNYTSSSRYYLQTYYFAVPSAIKTVTITDAEKIEQGAFNNCNDITNINLNDGITTIGAHAFENNSLLKDFTIPESVTSIGESAFYRDYSLTEVYIPDSVTEIPAYTFYGCTGIEKLVISKNTLEIGDYAFYNNSALKELVIPEKVKNIGEYAFNKNTTLTKIVIPDSVVTIGQYSFADNTKVTEMSIGSSLKTIPAYAFSNNTALTEIVVPDTITLIEGFAFNGCSGLKEVTLPFIGESRTATGYKGAFGYIFGTSYIVNANNTTNYSIYDGESTTENTRLSRYQTSSSTDFIPSRVAGRSSTYKPYYYYSESYGSSWYSCYDYASSSRYYLQTYYFAIPSAIKTVNITDAEKIEQGAFNNCNKITNIVFNDSIEAVGAYVFRNVPWYTSQTDEFVTIGDGALIKYNGTAAEITFPDDIKYIGGTVFQNNETISEVNLHKNIVGIGRLAFDGCIGLTSLTIPKTVTSIGSRAIPDDCTIYVYRPSAGYNYRSSNREILNDSYTTGNDTFYYVVNDDGCVEIIGCVTTSTELTVPTEINGMIVNKIGDYGFSNCTTIKSITIPSNIKSIGRYAFNKCTGLVNATIPTTVDSVGDYAFYYCTGLVNVTISEGVESIGVGAFYNCTSLVEAVVPDTAVKVGSHAFYNCTSMTTATIGITADAIGDYTFYNCEKLDTIVIGISVERIGDYAFYNCALEKLSVPATVIEIGDYAFASNETMTRATLRKNLLTIGEGAFQNCSAMSTVSIPSSVTEIGKAAFENCASITTITVPVGVTVINDLVFSGCEKLATVKLNGEVTSIGISAFYNCAFANITLPEKVEVIDASAFRKCVNLTEITIPDATKTIGDSAFIDCKALAIVSLPDDVTSVGNGVFFYNNDLTVEIRYLTGTIAAGLLEKQGVCHVKIDENITTVGDRAFAQCYTLSDITYGTESPISGNYLFSKNIDTIGKEAFVDDVLLKNLIVPDSIQAIGADAIYNPIVTEYNCKDVTATFYYVNGSIAANILNAQDFTHIVVNDNIHTLGDMAFANCDQLITISLPDTICSVGTDVFKASSGKLTATIRGVDGTIDASVYDGKMTGVQYLVIDENVDTIGTYAFANSSTIIGVVINNTDLIDDYAFYKGDVINYVEIGSTETIDAYAFAENLRLQKVEIDKVKSINDYAFFNCIAMNNIYIDSDSGLVHIGEHSFEECKLMPEMILPATVRNIGAYAFYNCNSMTYINIPDGVPAINDYTFFGCASLKEMLLPNSVITVGDWAFYGCVVVKNMTLGNQTESIGEYAFYNCNQIVALEIPETVTEIGDYAFRSCSSITELHIPDSVINLGDCVFYSCTGLEQVEFGTGITAIGDRVFYACVELDKVVFNAPVEEIHDLAFYGAEDATLYAFEDEYVETYCNDFGLMYYNLSSDFTMTITAPSKTEYNEYEELDLTGLALNLTYTNGSERTIKTGYSISGYDPAVLGVQTITVTYNGETATFDVNVVAKTVSFISITAGSPVDAIVGEKLDCSAMIVKVTFTDGTSVELDGGYTVTGYDAETIGEQTLTVSYRESSTEMDITVKDYVRGDTNGDGLVTMKDVTRLVNYLNDASIAVIDKALDVNGDGYVTIKDVTRLTEYLEDNTVEIF